ncbi:MAG: helix-turn-helix domain-containing protein [Gemmatimonadota bacterium]
MSTNLNPSRVLRTARRRAGLTQRELARRAETAQSVVARIELGQTSPSVATLSRLLAATGFELRAALAPRPVADSHMLNDVARILSLTPEDRLLEARNLSRFETAARRV